MSASSSATTPTPALSVNGRPLPLSQLSVQGLSTCYADSFVRTDFFHQKSERRIKFTKFTGSLDAIEAVSLDSIVVKKLATIAARRVSLYATNKIKLGMEEDTNPDKEGPVYIFAPQQLTIVTNVLSVGNFKPMVNSDNVTISCKTLRIREKSDEGVPESVVEMFQSWIINENAETIYC
ncbi:MAG: hypothetical protein K940chlam7_00417 [Chlamydiae bacterium]|nr:hypothetical protein [Chlamydiota bacterium]